MIPVFTATLPRAEPTVLATYFSTPAGDWRRLRSVINNLPASLPGKRAGSKTLDALPELHNAAILVFLPARKDLT
jgi:hypothetical protein